MNSDTQWRTVIWCYRKHVNWSLLTQSLHLLTTLNVQKSSFYINELLELPAAPEHDVLHVRTLCR